LALVDTNTKSPREIHYRITLRFKAEFLPRVLEFIAEHERGIYSTIDVRKGVAPPYFAEMNRF
jgi:hypothetical protein